MNVVSFLLSIFFAVDCLIEVFPTITSIGITRTTESFDGNSCSVSYCHYDKCFQSIGLTRIGSNKYVGSIFFLESDMEYLIKTTCGDEPEEQSVRTKKEPLTRSFENEIYVSPNGFGKECTRKIPCSISYASLNAEEGTSILLLQGVYERQRITLSNSGTFEKPITIKPASGVSRNEVIFTGAYEIDGFYNVGQGVYRRNHTDLSYFHLIVMENTKTEEKRRLLRFNSASQYRSNFETFTSIIDENEIYEGITGEKTYSYSIDYSNGHLDINIDDLNLNDYNLFLGDVSPLFRVLGDYVYIFNITIQLYSDHAIYNQGASHMWIKDCVFDHNDIDVYFSNENKVALDCVIDNNDFYDSAYFLSHDAVKDMDNLLETGAISTGDEIDQTPARGLIFRYNKVYKYFNGLSINSMVENWSSEDTLTNEYDIHNNEFFQCIGNGIDISGISSNVRVYNNKIIDCDAGIGLVPNKIGPTFVINNVIKIQNGWTSVKFFSDNEQTGSSYFWHNTIDALEGSRAAISLPREEFSFVEFKNNIFLGSKNSLEIKNGTFPFVLDYNVHYHSSNNVTDYLIKTESHIDYNSLADFFSDTGDEENGHQIDNANIFKDDMYVLKDDSQFINLGEIIFGINDDLENIPIGTIQDLFYQKEKTQQDDNDDKTDEGNGYHFKFLVAPLILLTTLF